MHDVVKVADGVQDIRIIASAETVSQLIGDIVTPSSTVLTLIVLHVV